VAQLNARIKEALQRYGLAEPPDIPELARILAATTRWMGSKTGAWNVGYPVYAKEAYFDAILEMISRISHLPVEDLAAVDFGAVVRALDEADEDYYSDVMST
jgi:hypothetical protein